VEVNGACSCGECDLNFVCWGKDVDQFASSLGIEVKQFRCFAHVLNLAAQAALGIIRPEIDELREFIKEIRNSGTKSEVFLKFSNKVLILDCRTRWNSTFEMLVRVIELKDEIRKFIKEHGKDYKITFRLTAEALAKYESLIAFLKAFYDCTNLVSSTNDALIGNVFPAYSGLLDFLETKMKHAAPNSVIHRWCCCACQNQQVLWHD
jgi:hypothetical protein